MNMLPESTCCEMLKVHLIEGTILYIPKFRKFGIPVLDGGTSYIAIQFCPWCGHRLPIELSEEWFQILDTIGIEYYDAKSIPEEMNTDTWWKKKKL